MWPGTFELKRILKYAIDRERCGLVNMRRMDFLAISQIGNCT